jgi:hypothetical protein
MLSGLWAVYLLSMRHTRWGRCRAALLALWLVALSAGPAAFQGFHRCAPLEGTTSAPTGTFQHAEAHSPAAPHGHRGHTPPVAPARGTHDHAPHHDGFCLGTCCCVAPLTVPAAAASLVAIAVATPRALPPAPRPSFHPTAPDHARPPSLGPPSLPVG